MFMAQIFIVSLQLFAASFDTYSIEQRSHIQTAAVLHAFVFCHSLAHIFFPDYFVRRIRCHFGSLYPFSRHIDDGYFFCCLVVPLCGVEKMRFFMSIWKSCTRHASRLSRYWLLCYSRQRSTFYQLAASFFHHLIFYYITKSLLVFSWWFSLSYCGSTHLLSISTLGCVHSTQNAYIVDVFLSDFFAAVFAESIIGLNLFNHYARVKSRRDLSDEKRRI